MPLPMEIIALVLLPLVFLETPWQTDYRLSSLSRIPPPQFQGLPESWSSSSLKNLLKVERSLWSVLPRVATRIAHVSFRSCMVQWGKWHAAEPCRTYQKIKHSKMFSRLSQAQGLSVSTAPRSETSAGLLQIRLPVCPLLCSRPSVTNWFLVGIMRLPGFGLKVASRMTSRTFLRWRIICKASMDM